MKATDAINEYFELMRLRPDAFAPSSQIEIVTDREEIEKYIRDTGEAVGVVYRSPYNTLVVDLIRAGSGYYRYERILPTSSGAGAVCVPVYQGKLVLIRQYRHAIRDYQLSFPRGFGEDGLTGVENAKKELSEEIGAATERAELLGRVAADSGLSGGIADVVLCEISSYKAKVDYEGICGACELTPDELEAKIAAREITDGFTLSAFAMYKAQAK